MGNAKDDWNKWEKYSPAISYKYLHIDKKFNYTMSVETNGLIKEQQNKETQYIKGKFHILNDSTLYTLVHYTDVTNKNVITNTYEHTMAAIIVVTPTQIKCTYRVDKEINDALTPDTLIRSNTGFYGLRLIDCCTNHNPRHCPSTDREWDECFSRHCVF